MKHNANRPFVVPDKLYQAKLCQVLLWVCLGVGLLSITGCDSDIATSDTTGLSSNKAIIAGQNYAVMSFLSKKWQLYAINDKPVGQNVVLDFTNIKDGAVKVDTDCQSIPLLFDVSKLPSALVVNGIHREIKPCSDAFEDNLMSIMADVSRFERQDDSLKLVSYQDNLLLVAR